MQIRWTKHCASLASMLLAVSVLPAADATKRVAPEFSAEGLTLAEYQERQAGLHAWLSAEIPADALANPIAIELSREELDEVNRVDHSRIGEPLKVGIVKELSAPITVSCQTATRQAGATCSGGGTLQMTDDGGFVWTRAVSSSDAAGIRVHLTGLSLPDDADLYFLSPDGEAFGPFQHAGPNGDGELWLPSVFSDKGIIVVRHFGPDGARDLPRLTMEISEIGHIGDGFFGGPSPTGDDDLCGYNASCVQNATCQPSGPATAAESAVAKMLWIAGCCIHICSGGLIADTDAGSEVPYFLTANHCMSKNNEASNLEAYFQYQMSCGGACPASEFSAPPAPRTVGASIEATSRDGDFTLLRLDEAPPSGSVYLGWNSAPVAFSSGAELHRISHPSGAPQAYSEHAVDSGIGTCLNTPRGEFIYSDDVFGATEGGSSGSPVVNGAGEIVGQLTGCCAVGGGNCNDVCNSNNHTIDGAFAYYFPSVESILDPSPCNPSPEICDNGSDDDCDGATDCDDSDCTGDPACGDPGCVNPGGAPAGASCDNDADCCSDKCKGPPNNKSCR